MKIAIGNDKFGFRYKHSMVNELLNMGHNIIDVGIHDETINVDQFDIVLRVAKGLLSQEYERVILLSETGIGMALAANKIKGLYAAACNDIQMIHESIVINNCNVLCLGSKHIDSIFSDKLVEYWLALKYDPDGEYAANGPNIKKLEERWFS